MIGVRRWVSTAVLLAVTGTGAVAAAPGPAGAASPSDRCYAAGLHQVFLGRAASVYDIEAWTDRYAPAPSRPALPRALATSDEWLEAVVTGIYDAALDRAPDADGLAFWIAQLRAGTRVTTLTARIYGSDEVWNRAGGTAEGFVADVFPRIMGRAPSSDDTAYWPGEVAVRGRGGVARALTGSIENRRTRVTALYQQILGRAPDTAGRDYWVGRLATVDDVQLAVHLASSSEAYQRAQTGCTVPPAPTTAAVTEGDRSSITPKMSADGRYVAFLSRATDLVPGDTSDTILDLFLWDRTTDTTSKVTHTDRDIRFVDISADGHHIAFATTGGGLTPGSPPSTFDIFTWARQTDTFTRVTTGDRPSIEPALSADGRYIAFPSEATDLVEGDDNGSPDVFVWDRTTATVERITDLAGLVESVVIAPDGQRVAYGHQGPDGRPPGEGGYPDIYVWKRDGGTTTNVFVDGLPLGYADDDDLLYTYGHNARLGLKDHTSGASTVVTRGSVDAAAIAGDGSSVVFSTHTKGVVPEDQDGGRDPFAGVDAFVWERATGTVVRLGDDATVSDHPAVSADGRYVAYQKAPPPGPAAWAQIVAWDRGS